MPLLSFGAAEPYLLDIGEMLEVLIQFNQLIKVPAARMVAAPRPWSTKVQTVEEVCFPLGDIRILVKPVFQFRGFVPETFRTKGRSNEIVAEFCHVTFQR